MSVLRRLWNRLDARGRELRRLAQRNEELAASVRELRRKDKRGRDALKAWAASRHRRIPSPEVVRDLLPLRAGTIAARAAHADASRRDVRLQELSATYRDAIAHIADVPGELAKTSVDGLAWWVPVPESLGEDAARRVVSKQRFPYRNISQTREFSTGPVMLDIGANVGRMSIPRVVLGDFERAYCAEPDPLNFAALVRNIAENGLRGLVLPDRVAIGSTAGRMRLQQAKYGGGHRLTPAERSDEGTIEVSCWTLDAWCEHLSVPPDLVTYVKVDTQGWELHVLRGAPALLDHRHIAWQLEVTPALLEAAGTSAAELYDLSAQRFSHFVDLGKRVLGPRVRRTTELASALSYLSGEAHTDIVLFHRDASL